MLKNFVQKHKTELNQIATAVRVLGMDAVLKSKSGHVGLPLGGAEIGTLLYFAAMHHTPKNPLWHDRDRFVLSAGHGSMLQYALLHLSGYDVSKDDLINFRQWGSKTPGHPEFGHTAGVECTTGPLGQGLSMAVGMAVAERMLEARFGKEVVDHHTYVLAGDGCLMEGVASEACSLAGHLKLNRLVVFYDANNITIDGTVDISFTENVAKRFEAYGFHIFHADGNNFESLAEALDLAHEKGKLPNGEAGPSLIICKGVAGKGSPKWEGKPKIHGNPMSAEDVEEAKKHLGLAKTEPFWIPEETYATAKKLIHLREEKATQWCNSLVSLKEKWSQSHPEKMKLWRDLMEAPASQNLTPEDWNLAKGKMATRTASGKALVALAKHNPQLVGGSADLAGSNLTTIPDSSYIHARDFSGRNIHFGVREHGMGAICNGITLHGGLRGYCATFLVFSDYMRPAIRLAALMKAPTLFIFTHDSYGVGEDGPTHQPVEHADSLRVIPNLNTLRPADALETFAAWEYSLQLTKTPSCLLFTRQDVPDLDEMAPTKRNPDAVQDAMKKGAYLLKDFSSKDKAQITLVSSGSEVQIALQAALELEKSGTYAVRVISSPAPQKLIKNPLDFNELVPSHVRTFAVEATSGQSFGEIVGRQGAILSMKDYGASAPFATLSEKFGFTCAHFVQFVTNQLSLGGAEK